MGSGGGSYNSKKNINTNTFNQEKKNYVNEENILRWDCTPQIDGLLATTMWRGEERRN